MNCIQFRRLLTPAVDGRVQGPELVEFEQHAGTCPSCREQFELEQSVKKLVRLHVPMVKTPDAVRETILRQVRGIAGGQPVRKSWGARARVLLRPSVLRPAGILLFLALSVFFLLYVRSMDTGVASSQEADLLAQSLQQYRSFESGVATPVFLSEDHSLVHEYLTRQTRMSVLVPHIPSYTLIGGTGREYRGVHMAHVWYRKGGEVLSLTQVPFEDVLHGKGPTLPLDVRNQLLRLGVYTSVDARGDATVLWTNGPSLCAAISRMDPGALQRMVDEHPEGTPAGTPW